MQREVGHPCALGVADAPLGPATPPVEGFEVGDVVAGEVGHTDLEPVAFDVGECHLGAGVGILPTGDHPSAGRPARQVDQGGDLGVLTILGTIRGDGPAATPTRAG